MIRLDAAHFFDEFQLVLEFRIYGYIRLIAACWHIKIMHNDRNAPDIDKRGHMTAVINATEFLAFHLFDGMTRKDGNAVIGLLAMHSLVNEPVFLERILGKLMILTFYFLQANHIWILRFNDTLNKALAQSYGIDIPSDKFEI